MLAYVYWHAKPDNVTTVDYETSLLNFNNALANAKISGLLGNASYAIGETPWLEEPGYEDWTWLEGSWALDSLNERAVSASMERPHNAIAQMTKHGGIGALYYLVAGEHKIPAHSKVSWLSRPRGINWREFIPVITQSANSKVAVWRRLMVLGPAPEFAVIGTPTTTLTVPEGWKSLEVQRRRLGQC